MGTTQGTQGFGSKGSAAPTALPLVHDPPGSARGNGGHGDKNRGGHGEDRAWKAQGTHLWHGLAPASGQLLLEEPAWSRQLSSARTEPHAEEMKVKNKSSPPQHHGMALLLSSTASCAAQRGRHSCGELGTAPYRGGSGPTARPAPTAPNRQDRGCGEMLDSARLRTHGDGAAKPPVLGEDVAADPAGRAGWKPRLPQGEGAQLSRTDVPHSAAPPSPPHSLGMLSQRRR